LALIFVLAVFPPSVSSTAPNLEMVPLSTKRCGIWPEASLALQNEKQIETLLLSSSINEYLAKD
jgi:hypothetical protein